MSTIQGMTFLVKKVFGKRMIILFFVLVIIIITAAQII